MYFHFFPLWSFPRKIIVYSYIRAIGLFFFKGFVTWQNQASLVAQAVKNLPAVQEAQVPSLGWEDPLEKGMATHSSTLAWRIPWTEEPGGLQSVGLQRVGCD